MKKKNSIIAIGIVVGIGLIAFLVSFTSSKFNNISKYKLLEAPDSGNEEDLEFLKYKVTLKNGTYMEYDQTANTYNWS